MNRLLFVFAASLAFAATQILPAAAEEKIPRVAVVTTVWYQNSHAEVLAGRILQGNTLDGQGEFPKLKLVSLYCDQFPTNDKSRELAKQYGFPIYDTIAGALTLGGDKLAVDGVLLIAEHGKYEENEYGSFKFPKRRMFGEIFQVFEKSGRVVPVFSDKHLSDNWTDIAWIYGEAQRLKVPLMAGSSVPTCWRYPAADVKLGEPLKEIAAISYHRLDTYGFHALEMVQCLAERRKGGETGIKQVRCLEGDAMWDAIDAGLIDKKLLAETLKHLRYKPIADLKMVRELTVKAKQPPSLMVIDYADGLRASVLTANGAFGDWAAAWRYGDGRSESTCFGPQENRPFAHFTYQLKGVEKMMHTGQPSWPVERTLLTSGALDSLLISRAGGGKIVATPQLSIRYAPGPTWQMPPPPPADRPLNGK